MLLTLNLSLGQYLAQIETKYGAYYPDRDGVVVNIQGEALLATLQKLDSYKPGKSVVVGEKN